MKNIVNRLISRLYAYGDTLISGALIFGLFQVPFAIPTADITKPNALKTIESVQQVEVKPEFPLTETFFGEVAKRKETAEMIEKKIEFVSTRPAYPASLAVIKKHEKTIREKARENGVPQDVAIGVGLLENGGSETAKSPAGALGVFQLMPGTAKNLGLTVNKKVDERRIPEKNIDAGMRYLRGNFDRFGDWGLATWAYHAGEGNVSKALKLYAKANHGVTLAGVKEPKEMREYVERHGITIHKLLSHPAVKTMTKKLKDDSEGYPYKVIATATLFKDKDKARTSVSAGTVAEKK